MRRKLAIRSFAVSSVLVLAFVVPLCALVRSTAEDQAADQARADVSSLVPVVAVTDEPTVLALAAATTVTGQANRMVVATEERTLLGAGPTDAMLNALTTGRSITLDTGPRLEVIRVVRTADGALTAIAALVPESERRRDVYTAWAVLAGTGLVLIIFGVFATDRLGRSVVRSVESLSDAARKLGEGDLSARVEPSSGIEELQTLGRTFNVLGSQVDDMLEREREMLATMSHRLRTPLTRLRLRADQVEDDELAQALRSDLDDTATELTRMIDETRRAIDDRSPASQVCDVVDVVQHRLRFWRVLADEQGRDVVVSIPDEAADGRATTRISERNLREIVDLLVENVFAHSAAEAGLDLALRVGAQDIELTVGNRLVARDSRDGRSRGSGIGHEIIRSRIDEVAGSLSVGAVDDRYLALLVLPRASQPDLVESGRTALATEPETRAP